MFQTSNPALVIIDVQQAIDHFSLQQRNNPQAESQMALLLAHWRQNNWPIVHVRHASRFAQSPYHPESGHYGFKPEVTPRDNELVITKQVNTAFIGTSLDKELRTRSITEIAVCGVLANHSVDATVRVAAALGYTVYLPHDATASFGMSLVNGHSATADDVHWMFLSNLDGEYCSLCTTQELVSSVSSVEPCFPGAEQQGQQYP